MTLSFRRTFIGTAGIVLMALLAGCSPEPNPNPSEKPLAYVDPLIGTGSATTVSALRHSEADNEPRGQTVPTAGVPFGMTQWTPQTRDTETKCVAPYYHSDTRIQGFRGSHWMSGSCTQDYGSVTIMPMTDVLRTGPEARASAFSRETETASPAYYRVHLDDYDVDAEMTGTARAGLLRFTFQDNATASFIITPNSDEGVGSVELLPEENAVRGSNPAHRIYQGWGQPAGFSGHFEAVFDKPFKAFGTWKGEDANPGALRLGGEGDSTAIGVFVQFDVSPGEVIHVKVGTSFTSVAQAQKNLDAEIPGWDFDAVRAQAELAWNDALGVVTVEGGTEEERVMFYSALYHAMLLPRLFSDADGSYVGFADDDAVHTAEGFDYYADFSLWDTYRAVHPLLTLLAPQRAQDMVQSLLAKAEHGQWLPTFPSWNSYTSAMIGDHAIPVIVDAYMKGIEGFDAERAYAFMLKNATQTPDYAAYLDGKGRRALQPYLDHGYLPMEEPVEEAFHKQEQVSRSLEYAYDDFVLAVMAGALGHEDDFQALMQRAAFYKNVIDPQTGFARGRYADGSWTTPFDPAERKYEFITEGTPFHYTWYVPQDMAGLIDLMGGRERFVARLDTLFDQGLYWHGNEPSHHIAYLYNYAGAPWKTQARVRRLMAEEYGTGPGGLSGNDDAGQMSAWYAFSALGLYPVAPGLSYYAIGSPLFEVVTFRLANGRTFTINAEGASASNMYIQSATLNGEAFDRPWIMHEHMMAGGTLTLQMGPEPEPSWGHLPQHAPPSMSVAIY